MKYIYQTKGTCSKEIHLDVENGVLKDVFFVGGCDGNLQGISKLVRGMDVEKIIEQLEGIRCDTKSTSCPDQLCKALHKMKY
ncbi:MAG: TIGR03905 family TSCPD domain-containing protein [Bacteroidaceae bacterium]|nr:TIGR03905 family TSCPD domain-containing protein [Bacteroidaceae bacterium]